MSNTKMSKYVNVFSLWNEFSGISEPIHSRILHFFLSDNPMHGQGKLSLSAFLEYIGFEFFLNCRRQELVCGTLQYEGHDGPRTEESSID